MIGTTGTTGRAPIEAKVQAAGVGGGAAGIVLWVMQTWVFKSSGVPAGLVSLVDMAIPAILALAAGWLAPHTSRTPPPLPVVTLPMGTAITTANPMPPAAAVPEPPAAAGPPA